MPANTIHASCALFQWLKQAAVYCFLLLLLLCPAPTVGAASLQITDDAGRTITLQAPAARIVPMYAAFSEMLEEMGKQQAIVARTNSDNAAPPRLPVIGTHMRPNLEMVTALAPDLVLVPMGREEADLAAVQLEKMGVTVARFRLHSFAGLFACMQRLGTLTGAEDAAGAAAAAMQARLAKVEDMWKMAPAKPAVFFEVRYPNLLGAGAASMAHDIISKAGGSNVLANHATNMVRLNEEALPALNPDVYLVQQGPMNKNPLPPPQRPHFAGLRAVATGRWLLVDEELFSRPGPGSVQAVELLAAFLYPRPENSAAGQNTLPRQNNETAQ